MSDTKSGGIGFLGVLFIAFLVLKLCKIITWSWWLITIPLWGGIALVVAILLIIGIIYFVGKTLGG